MEQKNLWKKEGIPHIGWELLACVDLGFAEHICDMCGQEEIRYVHTVSHPSYPKPLEVGQVCAGKMTGDLATVKANERTKRNEAARVVAAAKRALEEEAQEAANFKIIHDLQAAGAFPNGIDEDSLELILLHLKSPKTAVRKWGRTVRGGLFQKFTYKNDEAICFLNQTRNNTWFYSVFDKQKNKISLPFFYQFADQTEACVFFSIIFNIA